MVVDEEIDNVIALWPLAWKIGFKSSARGTAGTSMTQVPPPVITKEIRSTGKDSGVATKKDT